MMKALYRLQTHAGITAAILALAAVPTFAKAQTPAPAPAPAPAVAPADLVGSWAAQGSKELGFTFRADSTMSYSDKLPQGKVAVTGRWRLAGDTLVVQNAAVKLNGKPANAQMARRLVAFENQHLRLTKLEGANKAAAQLYDRVDSLQTETPKP